MCASHFDRFTVKLMVLAPGFRLSAPSCSLVRRNVFAYVLVSLLRASGDWGADNPRALSESLRMLGKIVSSLRPLSLWYPGSDKASVETRAPSLRTFMVVFAMAAAFASSLLYIHKLPCSSAPISAPMS
jgi:hypothetical protein